jgi:hypothetical protein
LYRLASWGGGGSGSFRGGGGGGGGVGGGYPRCGFDLDTEGGERRLRGGEEEKGNGAASKRACRSWWLRCVAWLGSVGSVAAACM